jgi:hypothetical protein
MKNKKEKKSFFKKKRKGAIDISIFSVAVFQTFSK